MTQTFAGAALATPLATDLTIDQKRLVEHAQTLLQRGLDTVTLFGTTGEGASFSADARAAAITACAAAGLTPKQLGSGVFANAAAEAAAQSRQAFDSGCGTVLLAPPSYFKGVDDEGLFSWFCQAIEQADSTGHFVLYHIPGVTQVELSVALCRRLGKRFPGVVTGVKDSSGNWSHTQKLIGERDALNIFVGHEGQLHRGMQAGACGTISGTANVLPEMICAVVREGYNPDALPDLLEQLFRFPIIPAIKALIGQRSGDPAWRRVAPPLSAVSAADSTMLGTHLDALFPVEAPAAPD